MAPAGVRTETRTRRAIERIISLLAKFQLQLTHNWKAKRASLPRPFTCNWFTTRDQAKQSAFVPSLLATGLQLEEGLNCTARILSSSAPIFFPPAEPQQASGYAASFDARTVSRTGARDPTAVAATLLRSRVPENEVHRASWQTANRRACLPVPARVAGKQSVSSPALLAFSPARRKSAPDCNPSLCRRPAAVAAPSAFRSTYPALRRARVPFRRRLQPPAAPDRAAASQPFRTPPGIADIRLAPDVPSPDKDRKST